MRRYHALKARDVRAMSKKLKRRLRKKMPTASDKPSASVPSAQRVGLGPYSGIQLQGVAMRHLLYEELRPHEAPVPDESTAPVNSQVSYAANIQLFDNRMGELSITLTMEPDPARRPIRVRATMSALFGRGSDVSARQLAEFMNTSGAVILFPYLREVVSSVTGRGVYPPMHLNPIRLGPLLAPEALADIPASD